MGSRRHVPYPWVCACIAPVRDLAKLTQPCSEACLQERRRTLHSDYDCVAEGRLNPEEPSVQTGRYCSWLSRQECSECRADQCAPRMYSFHLPSCAVSEVIPLRGAVPPEPMSASSRWSATGNSHRS